MLQITEESVSLGLLLLKKEQSLKLSSCTLKEDVQSNT